MMSDICIIESLVIPGLGLKSSNCCLILYWLQLLSSDRTEDCPSSATKISSSTTEAAKHTGKL